MQAVLLSPEIHYSWEPTLCHERKAISRAPNGLALRSRRGLMGAGHVSRGSDGNSGDPVFSALEKPVGEPGDQNPGPSSVVLAGGGSETRSARTVPAGESTSPRDGWQEVGAPHSTDETGEPNLKGPGGGKGAPGHGTGGGKDGEDIGPRERLNETASDS